MSGKPSARSVTKSGSNRVRGSVFEFLRNDAFDAKNYFAQTKEKLERNQFGGTFGGPVVIPGLVDGRGVGGHYRRAAHGFVELSLGVVLHFAGW